MSRANTGVDPKRKNTQVDRRDAGAPRVTFEALVEVGAGASGGFEAESVDVSPDGIRLRTAYLPDMGERLVCRFDGFGGEVVAEGEVIWRRDQGRGGEFGLRFIGLDEHGAKLLQEMCQPGGAEDVEPSGVPEGAFVGSRVKLHIDGLGSPMRARVKDTAKGEVLVGSSLEFLRVGRDIELEDVEKGGRRTAMIEHVGVEIDRANNVPQLVVSLRYEDGSKVDYDASDMEEAPSAERHPSRPGMFQEASLASKETTPEPTVIDNDASEPRRAALPPRKSPRLELSADEDVLEGDDLSQEQPPTLATPALRARRDAKPAVAQAVRIDDATSKLGELAKSLGPKLTHAGASARGVLGSLLSAVKQKRAEPEVRAAKVKRTTAPPPSGALTSDGKRLFRQARESSEEVEESEAVAPARAPKLAPKSKAIAASVLGVLAVLGVYAVSTRASSKGADDATAAVAAAVTAAPETVPSAASLGEAPAPGGAVATANVPLFGATPLSTTEPVPTPPNPEALAADAEPGDAPPGAAAAEAGSKDPGAPDSEEPAVSSGGALRKEWGMGQVHDPISLKLTMDGEVAGFSGSEGDTGFTLVVPGRKSVSSASGLARKDKRIESLNVVNYPDRAEVTLHFKGDVPAYAVKSSGNRVSIDIDGGTADGRDEGKKKSKNSVKSGGHDKAKAAEKGRKHDAKNAKSDKSEKKSESKKADKKSDAKKAKK